MGEGLTPGEACGPHTTGRAPEDGAAPGGCVGASWLPFVSPSVSVYVTGKY